MMNHKEILLLCAAIRIYHCFLEIFSCLTNKINVKFLIFQRLSGVKILSDIIGKSNICQPLSVFSINVTFKMLPCIYSPSPDNLKWWWTRTKSCQSACESKTWTAKNLKSKKQFEAWSPIPISDRVSLLIWNVSFSVSSSSAQWLSTSRSSDLLNL